MSDKSKISWTARILSKLLLSKYGKVRAMERALRLQSAVRFAILSICLIIGPSLVLAYFGLKSIKDQEEAAKTELIASADVVSRAFIKDVSTEFSRFESLVRYLLEAGRAPNSSINEFQRIVLRFDKDQKLIYPFLDISLPRKTSLSLLRNHSLLLKHESDVSEDLQAMIAYRRAVSIMGSKSEEEVLNSLIGLRKLKGDQRMVEGGVLRHFIDLKRAQLSSQKEREKILRNLMIDLINSKWLLRDGMESALSVRVLAELKQIGSSKSRQVGDLDELQVRLDRRIQDLYWATAWEAEWRSLLEDGKKTSPGNLYWTSKKEGIWAQTIWNDEEYIFGLDKELLIKGFQKSIQEKTMHDSNLKMLLITPEQSLPASYLNHRQLPILQDWSVVVVQKNPEEFAAVLNRDRLGQIGSIGLSVLCLSFGLFLTFRVAANEVEVANIKSHFAASVSHELRSPITQIRLKGESLLFGLAETEEELTEHYEAIVRESERLSWLVDNVLNYAAIEQDSKHYVLRKNDLNETVRRVVDSLQVTLSMKNVEIELRLDSDLPFLRHDPDAVSQCVINLLSNAAKYSGEEKYILISTFQNSSGVDVSVEDQGIGISEEDLSHIFEPFFRSKEESARRRKGTGIGLAITKHIMEAHRGSILVRSRPGEGSTFTLRFPLELIEDEGDF
ncbi:MAG: HAMP domain-containing sensor histidine kinase [Myxococcota bacterium]|nr:HAMP domain-containing sensor histidine kinase [Myxococcota bacterium]